MRIPTGILFTLLIQITDEWIVFDFEQTDLVQQPVLFYHILHVALKNEQTAKLL